MVKTVALLLAGGTGTRLYPASRSTRPKQFLALDGDQSLLQETADRARFADELYVVTRDSYTDEVHDQLPEAAVLVEPAGKDTGPALVYAAHRIREQVGDCAILCLPSDHHITGDFETTARQAIDAAVETSGLVTIGIDPTRPATGYGYIEPGECENRAGYAPVESFREKPDAETAQNLVDAGYKWNAGMFAWTPEALLREAADGPLAPLVDALRADEPERGFDAVDAISIDYAVMERTENAYIVSAGFDWDDLGSWDALGRLQDGENTVIGDALPIDASGNVIASDDKHISLVGVDDLVVAAYDDRVLVVPREDAQRVREVVSQLREDGRF